MSLMLTVPDEIAHAAEALAQRSGETPERILLNALWAHFPLLPAELQAEFAALEQASDEDFAAFERQMEADGNAAG